MRIFYFGSICDTEHFNLNQKSSKKKASESAQNFEAALLEGLTQLDSTFVDVFAAESIAMFPKSKRIFLRKRIDLMDGYSIKVLPSINIPIVKQIIHGINAKKELKKWIKNNKNCNEKCVLVYGIYPYVCRNLIKVCKNNNIKIISIMTDVPVTMYTYTKSTRNIFSFLKTINKKNAINIQDKFDGYIYLTKEMSKIIAPNKPYIVVETIAQTDIFDNIKKYQKKKAIMYAGALYKKYGVDKIIDVFQKMNLNEYELWLFGNGDMENYILDKAKNDKKIKYFGRVTRDIVLKKELEASILINLRDPKEEYTKYSFPSKMIEYMLSGTPVVTTKIECLSEEYLKNVYTIDFQDTEIMSLKLLDIIKDPKLNKIGENARNFVIEEKNSKKQAIKIKKFLTSFFNTN